MSILQGTIFTPNKKKTLIDEIQQEIVNLDGVIKAQKADSTQKFKLNTIKLGLQNSLNVLYEKKGVVTPQETDNILELLGDAKRSRLESDYYMGMSKTTFYFVAFAAVAFGIYFYMKKKG